METNKELLGKIRKQAARIRNLEKALDTVLYMFTYQELYGIRLFYGVDGTVLRENEINKARALLKVSDDKKEN